MSTLKKWDQNDQNCQIITKDVPYYTYIFFTDAKRSMESNKTKGSGWQHIKTSDDETYAMIFDVYILYEGSSRNNSD